MAARTQVAIKPLYERGHHCKVCGRTTMHDYFAQQSTDGNEILHFRRCRECGILVCLDSPEEFAERCFRRETRRMRQRPTKRK